MTANAAARYCPLCGRPARVLDVGGGSFFGQSVDYYRCNSCGHVWVHDKNDPNAPVIPVTLVDVSARRSAS